ncbi:uncharacterized protein LOC143254985 [Tachypleus tridentatus]|uniref:uncharacterized protein LOC143254985 n=1 Tax=Tachypleus tridentatus TaxID=6853 RepID=UPI003FD0DAA7
MKCVAMPFLFPLSVLYIITDLGDCQIRWMAFNSCIFRSMGFSTLFDKDVRCATKEMFKSLYKMTTRKCINCDEYFHCQGNYNAVFNCDQNLRSRQTAVAISDCWQSLRGETNRRANRYGRRGGNCARKYLCAVNCKYNPSHETCSLLNC